MVASSLLTTTLLGTFSSPPAYADTPSEEEIQKRVKEVICASNARAEICWKDSFKPRAAALEEVLEEYPDINKAALAKYEDEINAPPGTVKVIAKGKVDLKMIEALGIDAWPIWYSNSIWPVLNKPYPYLYTRTELVYFLEGEVRVTPKEGEAVAIKAGDYAVLPKGLDCTWTIVQPVKKHYYEF
jgi:mannose-6-phosphate isomerase-like protein (cupin superfamily)